MTFDDLAKILGTGVVAAALTIGGTWLRESYAARRLATYSALRAAVTLETFALNCSAALASDSIVRMMKGAASDAPPSEEKLAFPPFPAFPEDIDWKILDPVLMAGALTLKNDVEISAAHFIAMTARILDVDNSHLATIDKMAESALKALDLAERLRKGLPSLTNAKWEKLALLQHRSEVAKEHDRRAQAQLKEIESKQPTLNQT